jgi:hypothetical protein
MRKREPPMRVEFSFHPGRDDKEAQTVMTQELMRRKPRAEAETGVNQSAYIRWMFWPSAAFSLALAGQPWAL